MTPTTAPQPDDPMTAAREASDNWNMQEARRAWLTRGGPCPSCGDRLCYAPLCAFDAGWQAAMAHRDADDAQDNPHVDDLGHGVFG